METAQSDCSDGKVLSRDGEDYCTQAVALLALTQGVIIHEIRLVTLFLEWVHSLVIHPPGVHNKTIHLLTCTAAKQAYFVF